MKKLIALTLTLLLIVLSLAACNSATTTDDTQTNIVQNEGTSEPPAPAPTTVTLTTKNVKDYLSISGVYGKITRSTVLGSVAWGESDFTLSIDPTVPGSFYNVVMTVEVDLTLGWNVSSSDPAFLDKDGKLTTTIKLPAYGSKEETHHLTAAVNVFSHDNQNIKINVTSISGTFKPEN